MLVHVLLGVEKVNNVFINVPLDMQQSADFYQKTDVRPPFTYASLIRQVINFCITDCCPRLDNVGLYWQCWIMLDNIGNVHNVIR